jgi:hypothetical protein
MRKVKEPEPDPYLLLMDPDPGGLTTCGSRSPTLATNQPYFYAGYCTISVLDPNPVPFTECKRPSPESNRSMNSNSGRPKGIFLNVLIVEGSFRRAISFQRTRDTVRDRKIQIWDPGSGITTPDHISERLVLLGSFPITFFLGTFRILSYRLHITWFMERLHKFKGYIWT